MAISTENSTAIIKKLEELFKTKPTTQNGMSGSVLHIYVNVNREVSMDEIHKMVLLRIPFYMKRSGTGIRILFKQG